MGLHFGDGHQYDNGVRTSVALNNMNVAVEVHESEKEATLWYHLGSASIFGVTWGASQKYDTGLAPSVAVNDAGIVVEVHESENDNALWYHVGYIEEGEVQWGLSRQYDSGVTPSVALNDDGVVVEVHQSQNEATLWYHVGKVKGDTIDWGPSNRYDKGIQPGVALNIAGDVVEVHKSQKDITLWYHVGNVNGTDISFGGSYLYDKGVTPSVSLNNKGLVVEVHKSQNEDTLWSITGVLYGDRIGFGESDKFDTGQAPSVACNDDLALQTHQSENNPTLWCSTGLVVDYAQWMAALNLKDRPLWQVTLPGTHDSGTYNLSDNIAPSGEVPVPEWLQTILNIAKYIYVPADRLNQLILDLTHDWGKAQADNIATQLDEGIRYFDLRPVFYNNDFYVYHGLVGSKISDILDQIRGFISGVKEELVVVNVSHFCELDKPQHQQLVQMITSRLADYLYKEQNDDLLATTIGQYVANGPRVLLIYRDAYALDNPVPGIWPSLALYDCYADKSDFEEMKTDQLRKMQEHAGNSSEMFLLSWTLTADKWVLIYDAVRRLFPFAGHSSLHDLSRPAIEQLAPFLKEYARQYQINVVYVDFYGESQAVDLAIAINR